MYLHGRRCSMMSQRPDRAGFASSPHSPNRPISQWQPRYRAHLQHLGDSCNGRFMLGEKWHVGEVGREEQGRVHTGGTAEMRKLMLVC